MLRCLKFVTLFVTLGLSGQIGQTAKILCVLPYIIKTPYILVTPYLNGLKENGHELTIISPNEKYIDLKDVRNIRVKALDQQLKDFMKSNIPIPTNAWAIASLRASFLYNTSQFILSDNGVKSFLRNENESFDLVIVEAAYTDALFGFAAHFHALLVGITAYGSTWSIDYLVGNPAPSVYEPMVPVGYKAGTDILQKFYNWINIAEEWITEQFVYLPVQIKLFKEHFPSSTESLLDIRRKFDLILLNQHFSLGQVRSNVPNLVEVAGIHLESPKTLCDPSLKQFLDESTDGVVFISMGDRMFGKFNTPEFTETLHNTIIRLKYRVIWRRESFLPENYSNIYIDSWLPQRDILAHPNVKLLITSGGILSTIEAVYYAVPMLALPVFTDYFSNVEKLKKSGMAITIEREKLNVEILLSSISELMKNPNYANKARELSNRFRDQPMSPLKIAIWWTEYVLRHKGAAHMRLPEEDISFVQYYKIDLISVMLVRIGFVAVIMICFCHKLLHFLLSIRLTDQALH